MTKLASFKSSLRECLHVAGKESGIAVMFCIMVRRRNSNDGLAMFASRWWEE